MSSESRPTKKHIGLRVRLEYDPVEGEPPMVFDCRIDWLDSGSLTGLRAGQQWPLCIPRGWCRVLEVLDAPA